MAGDEYTKVGRGRLAKKKENKKQHKLQSSKARVS